jgi:cytochrome c-type biogenesis protein CcmH/NrfG
MRLSAGGDRESARKTIDRLLSRNPRHTRALSVRAELALEAGDFAEAAAFWGRLPDDPPGDGSRARYLQGVALLKAGRSQGRRPE